MKQNKSLYYNKEFYFYYLIEKNISKINLKIKDDGSIIVSCPFGMSLKIIEKFLYESIDFIKNNKERISNNSLYNIENNRLSILGKEYKIIKTLSNYNYHCILNQNIFINYKNQASIENNIKLLLKKFAFPYLEKRITMLSSSMNIKYNSFKIKWMNSKWGYCTINKDIVINTKLIIFPPEIIDYVIIHELSHIIYMNHSKDFWIYVSKHCPNWKTFRKKLKI
ncbi:MAG: SprT family zinc-dependent metalloprotease [Mycoplasmoidaceae bacterium]